MPVGVDEIWLVHNIICQCGTCRHNLIDCATENCGHAANDRIAIRQLLDQGRTRDQVIAYFIQKYGGQVALAAPIDRGFNRLAWLLPYSIGAAAAGGARLRGLAALAPAARCQPPRAAVSSPPAIRSWPTSWMTSSATLTEPALRRRRIPLPIYGIGGAVLAAALAAGLEKLRWGPPLVMLALGGMTLALTAAALWRVIDPLTRADGGTAASISPPRRGRELEREKQLVLKAIKEVELDYQMRKIAERDYREMIERYRTRAMRLISEIEAGDDFGALIERELQIRLSVAPQPQAPVAAEAPVATDARPACPRCATLNDQDAEFCKKCGEKLATAS